MTWPNLEVNFDFDGSEKATPTKMIFFYFHDDCVLSLEPFGNLA
jgi:hypothetical protein